MPSSTWYFEVTLPSGIDKLKISNPRIELLKSPSGSPFQTYSLTKDSGPVFHVSCRCVSDEYFRLVFDYPQFSGNEKLMSSVQQCTFISRSGNFPVTVSRQYYS